MTCLKFYRKEEREFYTAYHTFLTKAETKRIINKLTRHFKFKVVTVKFYGSRQFGFSTYHTKKIRIPHKPCIGLLIHELAHQLEYQKPIMNKGHNKKLWKTITKFHRYAAKKNYWRDP